MSASSSSNLIKIWEIPGGIHPPQNKSQSTQLPLSSLPIPPQLIIPLNQHIGTPARPVVQVGDNVLAGQLIAAADGIFSANVHASSSGTILAIGDYVLPHPSGMSGKCITIATDGKHEFIQNEVCENYLTVDRLTLIEKIRSAGVAGLGGAGFPTSIKLNTNSIQKIDTLIINGAECEPYITTDDMLMQVRADDVIAGTLLLSHILNNPTRIVIGIEDNKPKAIAALQQAKTNQSSSESTEIEIISIPTKYPSGGEKQLIQILTGRETPSGHHPADIGVICVNVGTTAAAWRAVRFGEPLISRVTTVVGESLSTQRNIDVLIGTPINYVLAQHGFDSSKASRVVMGGSMMGFTLPDLRAPVTKTTNCILAPTKKELPPPPPAQACIRCGLCSEACPVSLLPQQLFWYAQAEDFERLDAHNLFDCIECGACSYVCPSKIPLVQYYRAAKGTIRQQIADKEKADRSRQRFEFRKARFAKEDEEKEAKRLTRKKAADEAKQKLAQQKANAATESSSTDGDTNPELAMPQVEAVVTALAKANTNQLSYNEQKARLERLLAAARNNLASARAPLVPKNTDFPITEEQLVRQKSRIKQTELNLADAEKKLADFLAAPTQPEEDTVAAAMARAKAKLTVSPEEKLRSNLEALQARLIKAQEKATQAIAEASPTANALQQGVEKMQQKIAEVQAELTELLENKPAEPSITDLEQNAADQAIAKAKAKAAILANMSDEEKHAEHIRALQARLEKAKERLAKAEADGDKHIETFRLAMVKLEEKLKETMH